MTTRCHCLLLPGTGNSEDLFLFCVYKETDSTSLVQQMLISNLHLLKGKAEENFGLLLNKDGNIVKAI